MKNYEQFLIDRKKGIGGSNAAAVFGMSPYDTPLSLYLNKIGAVVEKPSPAKAKIYERGHILEAFLQAMFERDYGVKVTKQEKCIHDKYEFIRGHVDGVVEADNAIVEYKTTSTSSKDVWGEELTDGIPKHYLLQCHHYMLIHDKYEKVYVPVYQANHTALQMLTNCVKKYGVDLSLLDDIDISLRLYVVQRNKKLEELMIKKYIEFWQQHVELRVPPTWSNYEDILSLFPKSEEKEVVADQQTMAVVEDIKSKQAEIKQLEEAIEKDKALICDKLQTAERLVDDSGKKLVSWTSSIRNSFDMSSFKEHHADLAEEFYKVVSTRTFRTF